MSASGVPPARNWREQILEIAAGWLFSDHPELPPSVVLPFENPDLHQPEAFTAHLSNAVHAQSITVGEHRGQRVGVLKSKFGAPAVAMTVEVLANLGVKNVVAVGFCGGLQQEIESGDWIVPLGAVRNEGASVHYAPLSFPALAHYDIASRLIERLSAQRRVHRGIVWTTDAVLMETTEAVREWSARRVLAVDMETSALFTVSHLAGVSAAAVLVASDHPLRGELSNASRVGEAYRAAATAALDVAADLVAREPA